MNIIQQLQHLTQQPTTPKPQHNNIDCVRFVKVKSKINNVKK